MADEVETEIDICALKKRLRDEYAFVNKQKRDLQKEYTSIVSTGDSLLRSLWIAVQQWRNINRLKGGTKFASECAYSSNLLDAISFQDGYAQVGFKEVKFGNFLRELRQDTDFLKCILILSDQMNLDTSAFVRTIIGSIYGSCLFPCDLQSVLTIVRSIIQYHLVYSENPMNIFSGDRNSFVNILNMLFQVSFPCRAFLILSCREMVFEILLDGSFYWTLDDKELLSVMAVPEVRKKFGEPGSPGTSERINDHMMRCWVALSDTLYALLKKINDNLLCLPDMLLWIISCFYKFALERGFNDTQAKQMVMRFFFNQIIVPVLVNPKPFFIDTEVRHSKVAQFNLEKVKLVLQTLVSIEAGDDVSYLSCLSPETRNFYDNLNREPLHKIVSKLVDQLSSKYGEMQLSSEESMPGIARTSVLITKIDLDSLVALVCKLKRISGLPQPSNNKRCSPTKQLINHASIERLLSNLEGIHSVTSSLAKMSFSTQTPDIQFELQSALQAFNKPLQEREVVLVISMGISTIECPGMLPEEKVLGMPTPKPRRKSTIQDALMNHVNELNENSPPSDSDSNGSSSDEKPPEGNEKTDDIDSAEDVLSIGFDDSFVVLPPKLSPFRPTNPFAQDLDPFAEFDSELPVVNDNDPFTSVITRLPEQPAQIHGVTESLTPSPVSPLSSRPSQPLSNNQGPLIDLTDLGSCSLPNPRSSCSVTADGFLNRSGSQSSTGSGKRFSSSASSGSDNGVKGSSFPSSKREVNARTDKNSKGEVVRRKSLKQNLQNVISNSVKSPKHEKKRTKGTLFHKKRRNTKKHSDQMAILDANDVATIIAASSENEKTPKVICDEIMHKYAAIKKDRPHKSPSITMETTQVLRDEEEVMQDSKNKLRLVLSNGSAPLFPTDSKSFCGKSETAGKALLTYLKQDLADAITIQDCAMIARLHETINTLEKLPTNRYPQVLRELQQDYLARKAYLSYLVRAQQGLVGTRQFLEKALERVDREREICRRYLMSQCVNMFMGNQKERLEWFVARFEKLQMSDEKSEEMKSFIQRLTEEFQKDPLWLGSNEQQQAEAIDALERQVMGRVYWSAVYAFGETDRFRDEVFHESVKAMCNSIGEDFALLEIKEEFQHEAPWYVAQYELHTLSAFKTPKDKLKCIQRCCTTIMSLLGMSSGVAVGADAFTPVLIYVVMHANPKGLLTTIDFINNYLNESLTGEQYYCWMQFCSAIQFIKILLEENKSR